MIEHVVFVTGSMMQAIIDAYSMNNWSDTGKYICFENGHALGVHSTDDGIFIERFSDTRLCIAWLHGDISLDNLKEVNGIYTRKEER